LRFGGLKVCVMSQSRHEVEFCDRHDCFRPARHSGENATFLRDHFEGLSHLAFPRVVSELSTIREYLPLSLSTGAFVPTNLARLVGFRSGHCQVLKRYSTPHKMTRRLFLVPETANRTACHRSHYGLRRGGCGGCCARRIGLFGLSGLRGLAGFSMLFGFAGLLGFRKLAGFIGLLGFSKLLGFAGLLGFRKLAGFIGLLGFSMLFGFIGLLGSCRFDGLRRREVCPGLNKARMSLDMRVTKISKTMIPTAATISLDIGSSEPAGCRPQ
jgi:hypothetical protein